MATRVPVGIEKVLFIAAREPELRRELLARGADREQAVARRGLSLSGSELVMLRMVPAAQLEANIQQLDTSGDNLERRTFLRAVAASAVAAGAAGSLGCSDDDKPAPADQGVSAKDVSLDTPASRGISPDLPGPDNKVKVPDHGPAPTGIRPGG